jgi:hypothetical protein
VSNGKESNEPLGLRRFEKVDPAVTALRVNAPREKLGAPRPARSAFTGDKSNDRLVLFAGPWPSHQCRVKNVFVSAGEKWHKLSGSLKTTLGVEPEKEWPGLACGALVRLNRLCEPANSQKKSGEEWRFWRMVGKWNL